MARNEPPRTRTNSGERPISTASALRFCVTVCCSGGMEARWVLTTLCCSETSSEEAVPAFSR